MDDYVERDDVPPDGCEDHVAKRAHTTMAGVFRITDELWERIEPLVPAPEKVHRFGGGRPRVPNRQVLDGIFFVLRTGCQWHALDATEICDGSTAHRRFQEWQRQGFFDALWAQALGDYDAEVGIDWAWLSIDGAMGKARWEAEYGAKPDRSRQAGSQAQRDGRGGRDPDRAGHRRR